MSVQEVTQLLISQSEVTEAVTKKYKHFQDSDSDFCQTCSLKNHSVLFRRDIFVSKIMASKTPHLGIKVK